jgi:hypothetical protein
MPRRVPCGRSHATGSPTLVTAWTGWSWIAEWIRPCSIASEGDLPATPAAEERPAATSWRVGVDNDPTRLVRVRADLLS